MEAGETPEAALVRELHEELGIHVAAADLLPLTFASHTYKPTFHLLMPLYGEPCASGWLILRRRDPPLTHYCRHVQPQGQHLQFVVNKQNCCW